MFKAIASAVGHHHQRTHHRSPPPRRLTYTRSMPSLLPTSSLRWKERMKEGRRWVEKNGCQDGRITLLLAIALRGRVQQLPSRSVEEKNGAHPSTQSKGFLLPKFGWGNQRGKWVGEDTFTACGPDSRGLSILRWVDSKQITAPKHTNEERGPTDVCLGTNNRTSFNSLNREKAPSEGPSRKGKKRRKTQS